MDRLTEWQRELAVTCWPLAYALALRRWLRYGGDRDELVSAAAAALVRAAQRYDPTRGAFTTVAQTYVVNELREAGGNAPPLFGPRPHACKFSGTAPRVREGLGSPAVRDDPSPLDAAITAEQDALVNAAIAALPPGPQTAVRAVYYQGMCCAHFSDAYGIPRHRGVRWLEQGLAALKRCLRREDFE